ncbi:MAG: 16S rRNA (guanine(527)-N(7))-methyltransferase RsmG [Planctomycetota bacterium]
MIEDEFAAALASSGLMLETPLTIQLQRYVQTMWRHNTQVNLTRHTTWELFVTRDLRDVLQLATLLQPDEEVLDLGSGNGVPGIPLSILRPDINMSLAESVGKRAKVLDALITELELPIAVYAARGEDLLEDFRFSTIVSRAVGSLSKFCQWMQPHWSHVDRLLLIKGPRWVAERAEARHLGLLRGIELRVAATYSLQPDDPSIPHEPDNPQSPDASIACESTPDNAAYGDPGQGVVLQLRRKPN